MILVKHAAYHCIGEIGKYGNLLLSAMLCAFNYLEIKTPVFSTFSFPPMFNMVVECVPGIQLQPIDATTIETPSQVEINHLEAVLNELEHDFVGLNKNDSHLRKNLNETREFQYVLQRVEQFFEVHMEDEAMNNIEVPQPEVREFLDHGLDNFSKSVTPGGHISGQNDIPLTPLLHDKEGENAW
ncbi:unnamed protein product [Cylicostephanus goldi]|uniref:Uncharacterized protein n=1 Tax=Cylicostephanus goldi TaxID=71465 RepID=A0A3P6QK42_CYLGO|nr:unnamed protein product [Cylicostephanus goldi]